MSGYHISPDDGEPRKCSASIRECPVGGNHYTTKEQAFAAYEEMMSKDSFPAVYSKSESYPKETVEKWRELARNMRKISVLEEAMASRKSRQDRLMKALESLEKGASTPSQEAFEAHNALVALHRSRPYVPNSHPDRYPSSKYPNFQAVRDDVLNEAKTLEHELQSLAGDHHETQVQYMRDARAVADETGHVSNPKYGVDSGVNTGEMWSGKTAGNYSNLPTKQVSVLTGAKTICKKCDQPVHYVKKGYGGNFVHESEDHGCDEVTYSISTPCKYCGTSDPSFQTFKHQAYSDETSCSRCGGVSGYAIGD